MSPRGAMFGISGHCSRSDGDAFSSLDPAIPGYLSMFTSKYRTDVLSIIRCNELGDF